MRIKKSFSAFTLAEVLITLGIIGVVAAMTIPVLVQKQTEKATVTKLKKFYSTISQSYAMAKLENGEFQTWFNNDNCSGSSGCADKMSDIFSKYMKIIKICHTGQGCFPDKVYKRVDGRDFDNLDAMTSISKITTIDGLSVYFYKPSILGYANIAVDINGYKEPNMYGKDIFQFTVYDNKIEPNGLRSEDFQEICNRTRSSSLGEACTAWVLYNENMDYLHCDDLSWGGKTKCDK